jgi:hypothetical protein
MIGVRWSWGVEVEVRKRRRRKLKPDNQTIDNKSIKGWRWCDYGGDCVRERCERKWWGVREERRRMRGKSWKRSSKWSWKDSVRIGTGIVGGRGCGSGSWEEVEIRGINEEAAKKRGFGNRVTERWPKAERIKVETKRPEVTWANSVTLEMIEDE